jgi:dipeptidyl aminopeptidase/acylaminoacyl peptidase
MRLFRRVLNGLFLLAGIMAGIIAAISLYFARYLINPPHQRLWANPGDLGLRFDDVQFPAQDGARLSGWFIHAPAESRRKGATIVLVHGWPWNRLGEAAEDLMSNLNGASPLDLLRLAYALHQEWFHVFMFDLRNHGESAAAPPVTFGRYEARDLLGALEYVATRPEVAQERMGAIGFSMGANTVLYTLPQTDQIKAAVVVQPTSVAVFAHRYAQELTGPLSLLITPLVEKLYQMAGGPAFAEIRPATAVAQSKTPVLYIQGNGDRWGTVEDVQQMAAATPHASGTLIVESSHRFGGYQYAVDNPKILAAFFEQHLPE